MRYLIKQRLMTLRPRFDILDETGAPVLEAVGAAIALHVELRIRSTGGAEFVRVRQKIFSLRKRFDVFRGDDRLATIQRRFTLLPTYSIDLVGGGVLRVRGSIWDHRYDFQRGEEVVARVSREIWAIRDTYGVEVFDPRLDAVVLAAVIAMDCMRAQSRNASLIAPGS